MNYKKIFIEFCKEDVPVILIGWGLGVVAVLFMEFLYMIVTFKV